MTKVTVIAENIPLRTGNTENYWNLRLGFTTCVGIGLKITITDQMLMYSNGSNNTLLKIFTYAIGS
jgi:hypothetical protein